MSFYNKSTNFAVKDSLTTGDPNKIVSGVEIDTEFTNIASGFSSVDSTKVDVVGSAVADNIVTLTSSGAIQDSGSAISDLYSTDDLKTDLNASGDAPIYAARAWLHFNGNNGSSILSSGNVDSITDLAVGKYQINLTEAIEDTDYTIIANCSRDIEPIPDPNSGELDRAYQVHVAVIDESTFKLFTGGAQGGSDTDFNFFEYPRITFALFR